MQHSHETKSKTISAYVVWLTQSEKYCSSEVVSVINVTC